MKRKTTAEVYECDNPDCPTARVFVKGDDELPTGWYFKDVTVIYAGGSGATDVYACETACIIPALEWAVSGR